MCYICNQPAYVRCNCVSAQPFCDQCNEEGVCVDKLDSSCVIYHFGNPALPSRLINLGMPNGSSAQAIFERIDQFVGTAFNYPIIPVDSETVDLTVSGVASHTLRADVNVSAEDGNAIVVNSDGLFVDGDLNSYKVKVDAAGLPRYLEDSVVGGTDGCISITTHNVEGLLLIQPSLAIDCLVSRICGDDEALNGLSECVISGICQSSGSTEVLAECLIATGLFNSSAASADNGLHIDGGSGDVYLGGTLLETTNIDQDGFQLSFLNPNISIGTATAQTDSSLYVEDITSNNVTAVNVRKSTTLINGSNLVGIEAFNILTGTTFTASGAILHNDAVDAQLNINYSGTVTLQASPLSTYSGLYGTIIKSGNGDISGNLITGGYFGGFAADNGDIASMAALRIAGPEQASSFGAAYNGTITDYYGIYFNDIGAAALNSKTTNKYNIFQLGSTGINSFSTAVVLTSDRRTKENIVDFEKGLIEIEKIRIVEYNSIGDYKKKIGVIAQELEEILPEAVQTQERGDIKDFKVVDYNVIFSTLVKAVQQLSARVKELESK